MSPTLKSGDIAYYGFMSGPVKCKVLKVQPRRGRESLWGKLVTKPGSDILIDIEYAEDHAPSMLRAGEKNQVWSLYVFPRKCLTGASILKIKHYYVQIDEETSDGQSTT